MSKTKVCSGCGGTSFDSSNDGSTVCIACGKVVDSSNIVSEIQFNDSSGVMGTFVSKTGGSRSYRNLGRDSRELSLENARRRLHQIASQVNLKQHHIDMALRMYQLAIEHNFTKGRRTQYVAATCLYIVCRRESTPHLLIDFSEAIQVNVFVLAHTFLAFSNLLCLQLPLVDPSLFIHRFANSLEFEEKTQDVAQTALKLVARMKRDWMSTGRRPAGICGASLFIAAKIHGFTRTIREIIQIVKIGESTLIKRLDEFKQTPASMLRFSEFDSIEIEDECDPPAFTRNREKEEAERIEKEMKEKMKSKLLKEMKDYDNKKQSSEDEEEEEEEKVKGKGKAKKGSKSKKQKKPAKSPSKKLSAKEEKDKESLQEVENEINSLLGDSKLDTLDSKQLELLPSTLAFSIQSKLDFDAPLPPLNTEIRSYPRLYDEVDPSVFDSTATLEDLSDDEIDSYLEADKEVINTKNIIWTEMNKEWILKNEQREKEIEEARASGIPIKKKRTAKKQAQTSEEALQEAIRDKAKKDRIMNLFKNLINPDDGVKEELQSPSADKLTGSKRSRVEDDEDEDEENEEKVASISHSLLSQQNYADDDYGDYDY